MVNTHDNQIALAVRGKVNGLVLIVADRGNLSCPVSEARDGFDYGHVDSPWSKSMRKLTPNYDKIK